MELPGDLNRASDFLNAADDFFALVSGAETYLLNKSCVSSTLVFQSSPLPVGTDSHA